MGSDVFVKFWSLLFHLGLTFATGSIHWRCWYKTFPLYLYFLIFFLFWLLWHISNSCHTKWTEISINSLKSDQNLKNYLNFLMITSTHTYARIIYEQTQQPNGSTVDMSKNENNSLIAKWELLQVHRDRVGVGWASLGQFLILPFFSFRREITFKLFHTKRFAITAHFRCRYIGVIRR